MFEFYDALPMVAKWSLWLIVAMLVFLAWIIYEAESSPTYYDEDMSDRVPDAEPESQARPKATRENRTRAEETTSSGVKTLRAVGGREIQPAQEKRKGA